VVTKSSADSISNLPGESGRLADAIAFVTVPVLKEKVSAMAGGATRLADKAKPKKAAATSVVLSLIECFMMSPFRKHHNLPNLHPSKLYIRFISKIHRQILKMPCGVTRYHQNIHQWVGLRKPSAGTDVADPKPG
jgi:hypothetical protein